MLIIIIESNTDKSKIHVRHTNTEKTVVHWDSYQLQSLSSETYINKLMTRKSNCFSFCNINRCFYL